MKKAYQFFSLRRCRRIFRDGVHQWKRLAKRLSPDLLAELEGLLDSLDQACQAQGLESALESAQKSAQAVQQFLQLYGKKSFLDHCKEFVFAICIALALAGLVRQMWFELYEIPTGSMRPTFKETDRVWVMKNAFGINTPFKPSHLYFEPQLLNRGNIVVITGEGLDLPDVDTLYFGLFPGKKRYVKRLCAKGGDTIYFYGGRIYGQDQEGKQITEFGSYEHIPFITFEGKVEQALASNGESRRTLYLRHMNIPLGRIQLSSDGSPYGQIRAKDGWKKEVINTAPHDHPEAFFEFWGIQNYGIARAVEIKEIPPYIQKQLGTQYPLYLEILHTPTLSGAQSSHRLLKTHKTWIPLDDKAITRLQEALYTARFYVRSGMAYRYSVEGPDFSTEGLPVDPAVTDGCYEFYDGIAYEIIWGGYAKPLEKSHPLYPHTPEATKFWYNSGIDFYPGSRFAARYIYFRDGDLVTLSKPFFEKGDPLLVQFTQNETRRSEQKSGYLPFYDHGAPTPEEIKNFGLEIPPGQYLLLGDNHAMSNDSRFFGAVPENNIQGSPLLIFWPPGERWGIPPQPAIPFWRASNVLILSLVSVVTILFLRYQSRKTSRAAFQQLRQRTLTHVTTPSRKREGF